MDPWMGGIWDNLESLTYSVDEGSKNDKETKKAMTAAFLGNRIQVKSLNFMRGRSFFRTLIIVDETQDLTPKKLKMIATRVGEGSKIIFLGNVAQIDDNYLTELTCGLSVLIRSFTDSKLMGHITLQGGVRSEFATEAEKRL
jgi:PhoH-like ATPase